MKYSATPERFMLFYLKPGTDRLSAALLYMKARTPSSCFNRIDTADKKRYIMIGKLSFREAVR